MGDGVFVVVVRLVTLVVVLWMRDAVARDDGSFSSMLETGTYKEVQLAFEYDPYFSNRRAVFVTGLDQYEELNNEQSRSEVLDSLFRFRPNAVDYTLRLETHQQYRVVYAHALFFGWSQQDQENPLGWNKLPRPAMYNWDMSREQVPDQNVVGIRTWPSPAELRNKSGIPEGHPNLTWCMSDDIEREEDLGFFNRSWTVTYDASPDSDVSLVDLERQVNTLLNESSPQAAIDELRGVFEKYSNEYFSKAGARLQVEVSNVNIGEYDRGRYGAVWDQMVDQEFVDAKTGDDIRRARDSILASVFKNINNLVLNSNIRERGQNLEPASNVQYFLAVAAGLRGIITDIHPHHTFHQITKARLRTGTVLRLLLHGLSAGADMVPLTLILVSEIRITRWAGNHALVGFQKSSQFGYVDNGVLTFPRGNSIFWIVGVAQTAKADNHVARAAILLSTLAIVRAFFLLRRIRKAGEETKQRHN